MTTPRPSFVARAALGAAVLFVIAAPGARSAAAAADKARRLEPGDLKGLAWRSIGPANMGGRVAAIALAPGNAKTVYVGFGTGGLWKSTNAVTTLAPVFDDVHDTSSIGAAAVCDAPADWSGWKSEKDAPKGADERTKAGRAKIVWVGTGESNGRNSSSWGHGVYRSTDGGASFAHVGLEATHDIPALAVHPDDPDTCYVAALGHLWGANKERGVYKTTDGGKTWRAVLRIDENTGAIDVRIDPENPDIVYAAMYDRRRAAWSYRSGGAEGGIYRSTDGGKGWQKMTTGLPERTGRIGLDIHAADPSILYAVIESTDGGWTGGEWSNRQRGGGVFRSNDRGATWERTSDFNPRSFYFSKVRVDPEDPSRVYLLGWGIYVSDDGGRTFRAGMAKVAHVDFHAMVIDPADPEHIFAGSDGGLYESHDRGKTWRFHRGIAVGQFYNITVDDSDPYRVAGGLQDNGSWMGVAESRKENDGKFMGAAVGISYQEWFAFGGGDGFHVAFDPEDANIVYAEWQGGNISRTHLDTARWKNIKPTAKEGSIVYRYNWNAPFLISPHDHTTLYLGGNHVFRLTDRGEAWERISGDLSTGDVDKIRTVGSDAETHGTVVALAESPLAAGRLWAGTDDGLIHVTSNGGATWRNVTPKMVKGRYVSKIEASRHDEKTAYAAIDGHRSDDFEPVVLATTDLGRTWKKIAGGLPDGAPVKVVREDLHNPDVLYAGTERAAYVTIDRGGRWVRLNAESLPPVAVDDLALQAREMDLVAGTHGRSVWVLDDVSPLSQLTPEVVASAFHVFAPLPGAPRFRHMYDGVWGDDMFAVKNPRIGAAISYWIGAYDGKDVKIEIVNAHGHVIRKLEGTNRPGINRVVWDLQAADDQRLGLDEEEMPEYVPAGTYEVRVSSGDHKAKTTVEVLPAP